ncbi:MAG: phytanoyl-CoA dioxygenase family protein [Sphingomonas sp.]|jgi:ectoine hydroxylase-related dioxygenase (phytanoyl-CoA dioxygenase family)|nr:phytanoyl-CoA dioxygenase family protein [Sphingomonas sp.]
MNALAPLSRNPGAAAEAEAITADLLDRGYAVVPGAMPPELVEALAGDLAPVFERTPFSRGAFYGANTKRFHGLLRRSRHTADFLLHPAILGAVKSVLGPHCDRVQLNLTQAIEIVPGGEAQPPHRDQDMWPVHSPDVEYLVNVMWPFTHYQASNGATVLWPGSHRRQDEIVIVEEEAIAVEMEPGSALLFLGSTLHAGGCNRTSEPRRGMVVSYSLGWLKPYELPWLAYPPEVARTFSPELAALAGYAAHRPNLGTYEGKCPSYLLKDGDELGAIDMLRPEQEELIGLYRSGALAPGGLTT